MADFKLTQTGPQIQRDLDVIEATIPEYSSNSTYAVGDLVVHNNLVFRCNTAIGTAEEWDNSHWTQTNLSTEINSKVPAARKVNNKALTSDITLTASDVGALADSTTYVSSINGSSGAVTGIVTTSDISDMATQTWVGNQGYLTSLPSNVAYKDINNQFSTQQKITDGNTTIPLVLKSTTTKTWIELQTNNLVGHFGVENNGSTTKPLFSDGTSNHQIALTDDTLKNAYHLGVADTYSVSNGITTITRKTGYFIINANNITEKGGDSNGSGNAYFLTDLTIIFNGTWDARVGVSNIGYDVRDIDGTWVRPDMIGMRNNTVVIGMDSGTTLAQARALCPIYVEYELETAYTEEIISDVPLNTLDQNGSEWLREEWEKTLQLWDEQWEQGCFATNNEDVSTANAIRSKNLIPCKPNTTYTISTSVSAQFRIGFFDSSRTFISTDTGVQAQPFTFTTFSNCYFIKLCTLPDSSPYYGGTYNHNIMLNKGDHAYPYEEYNGKIIHEKDLEIFESGENLFNKATEEVGVGILVSTGNTHQETNINSSDYIEIKPNTAYSNNIVGNFSSGFGIAFYDISKTFISSIASNVSNFNSFTTPSTAKYLRLCYNTTTTSNVMLNLGSTPQPYKEYVGAIVRQGDNVLLWENSSPYSSFANQSVTLSQSLDNFKFVVIEYKTNRYASQSTIVKFRVLSYGSEPNYGLSFNAYVSGTMYSCCRSFQITDATTVVFGHSYSNTNQLDTDTIPVAIYGSNVL